MNVKKILLATSLMASALTGQAYAAGDSYVGLSVGSSKADTGISNLTGTASLDEKDSAVKVFYGFNVAPQIAVELHYADLGEVSLKANSGDTYDLNGSRFTSTSNNVSSVAETTSFGAAGVFKLFEEATVNPYVKAGVHFWNTDATATNNTSSVSVSDDGFDIFFGLGAEVKLSDSFSIAAEYESYQVDSGDVAALSIGAKFVF